MKFISYLLSGKPGFGALTANSGVLDLGARLKVHDIGEALRRFGAAPLLDTAARHPADHRLDDIDAYRPVVADPQRIFCVGLNYEEHRKEAGRDPTANPTIFLRLASSQVGHARPIVCPAESDCLDFEGELAVVIGQGGRRIAVDRAWRHIWGIAPYNDASVRDWQSHTTQWIPGKNFPATGAFGPALTTADQIKETDVLELTTELNGQVVQQATTDMLIFSIPELIAYISTFSPLSPGDVIVTGTPGGVGFKRNPPLYLKDGDVISVHEPRLGRLENPVKKETPQAGSF